VRADAYQRRFGFISKLTLPAGTLDLARGLPDHDITLIGTKAMLAAHADLHPVLVALLIDAAREIHGGQGPFESAGEFPSFAPVDLPVAAEAELYNRHGPTFLHRYLPFWAATFVERAIVLFIPAAVILVPLLSRLPQLLVWRVRSRIYRWYGELALLERDVDAGVAPLPIDRWLADLDRIGRGAAGMRAPSMFASEVYSLRSHIDMVRANVMKRRRDGGGEQAGELAS
jgi:hypothetical protein